MRLFFLIVFWAVLLPESFGDSVANIDNPDVALAVRYRTLDQTAFAGDPKAAGDLGRLKGTWEVTYFNKSGFEWDSERIDGLKYIFDGNFVTTKYQGSERTSKIKIVETTKPRGIDIITEKKAVEGIYTLDGDMLQLCLPLDSPAARPTEFTTNKDQPYTLIKLKRIKN